MIDELRHVPPRYARVEFVPPEPPPSTKDGHPWHSWIGDPWSLLLTGPTGTGKSMLSAALWRSLGGNLWVRASQVAGLRYGGSQDSWESICSCTLLVIDELGRDHRGGAWEAVGELLSVRWERMKATIVTTNLSTKELAASEHSAPLMDRLADGWTIRMDGQSRRGR